jgi:hypothetical protein
MQVRNQRETTKRASGPSILAGMVSFLFGGGMFAVSIWGIWASRSISRSYGSQPMVSLLTYLVLFAPFAVIGSLILWAGWNKTTGNWPRRAAWQLLDALGDFFSSAPQHSLEPLDENTRKRLDAAGTNLARVVGVLAGTVLMVLGTLGLIGAWVGVHGSASHPGGYYLPSTRLTTSFAIGSAIAIIIGAMILRDTFRRADASWLVPLRIFTAVVSARVASDQARREQGKPLLDAPQSDRDKRP